MRKKKIGRILFFDGISKRFVKTNPCLFKLSFRFLSSNTFLVDKISGIKEHYNKFPPFVEGFHSQTAEKFHFIFLKMYKFLVRMKK